jgi:hypothetical protein
MKNDLVASRRQPIVERSSEYLQDRAGCVDQRSELGLGLIYISCKRRAETCSGLIISHVLLYLRI